MKTLSLLGLAASVLVGGITAATLTQAPAVELKVGDPAPNFALVGSDGKTHRLSDYKGRAVVLAWFPKAFTGG
jgi:peroxiredoxin Q/BCP